MKRGSFLAATAVTGTVAAVVPSVGRASTVPPTVLGHRVYATDWVLASAQLVWVRRYYVLNAFPRNAADQRPHVATARTIIAAQYHQDYRDALSQRLDADAVADLALFLRTGKGGPNTVRFRDHDLLPTQTDWPGAYNLFNHHLIDRTEVKP